MFKLSILIIFLSLLSGCTFVKFAITDDGVREVGNITQDPKEIAIVTSKYDERVKKYILENYRKIGKGPIRIGYLQIFSIDGINALDATGGELGSFSNILDGSYYFEVTPGKHSFMVYSGKSLIKYDYVKIAHYFEAGHEYFLGQISDFSNYPRLRYSFLLIDATEMVDILVQRKKYRLKID